MKKQRKLRKILATITVMTVLTVSSISTFAAEKSDNYVGTEMVANSVKAARSISLLDYARNFTTYDSTTFTVPTSGTATLVYGADTSSENKNPIWFRIENANTGGVYWNVPNYVPGSGAKVDYVYLPAGTYNVHCWGESNVTYACVMNFSIK